MNGEKTYVYLFLSRNKDNIRVENFKQRKKAFLAGANYIESDKFVEDFEDFINKGVDGECARAYVSVNPRNMEKVKRKLQIDLIEDRVNLLKIDQHLARIANKDENKEGKGLWLIDIDKSCKLEEAQGYIADINKALKEHYPDFKGDVPLCIPVRYDVTPNGWHTYSKPFDFRAIKWSGHKFIECNKDGMRLLTWGFKDNIK